MDALEQLRARIAGFPGYAGELERRRSDEFVRAKLGEALAELLARCGAISPELQQRSEALLLRAGFADQKAFAAHGAVSTKGSDGQGGDVAVEDLAALELADRANTVDAASLGRYLDDVTVALDRRDAAMRAVATTT